MLSAAIALLALPGATPDPLAALRAAVEPQVRALHPDATDIEVSASAAALRLVPACSSPLTADLQGQRASGHLGIRLTCAVPNASVRIPVAIDVRVPTLVARQPVPRGTALSNALLELRPMPLVPGQDYLADEATVLGLRTRTALRAGQALTMRQLEAGDWVRAGEQVSLAAGAGPLEVTVRAQALQNGGAGEQIRVRNLASGRIVAAWVSGRGRVRTQPPAHPEAANQPSARQMTRND